MRALLADEATDRREGVSTIIAIREAISPVEREQGSKNEELLSRKKGRKEGREEQGRKAAGAVERRVSFVFVQTSTSFKRLTPRPLPSASRIILRKKVRSQKYGTAYWVSSRILPVSECWLFRGQEP